MKEQLTKYQHQVPQHYLKLWHTSEGQVWHHDLLNNAPAEKRSTKRILGANYFYEFDATNPDNEVEDFLSSIENNAAPILKSIADLTTPVGLAPEAVEASMCAEAAALLSKEGKLETFLKFISAQLVRTELIRNNIEEAIELSNFSEDKKSKIRENSSSYYLVKLGMERLPTHLENKYTIALSYSDAAPFVTSDQPVAEVCANPTIHAQPVFNILHKTDTFLTFPLNPKFHCLLIPNESNNPIIKAMLECCFPIAGKNISANIRYRPINKNFVEQFRLYQTGFGRSVLISCQDESKMVANSPLKGLKNK